MINSAIFRQGTTPTLEITAAELDLSEATVFVTIEQGRRRITKTNYGGSNSVIVEPVIENGLVTGSNLTVYYSQRDTLMLHPGNARLQVEWVFDDDTADGSEIKRLGIARSLFKGVKAYG